MRSFRTSFVVAAAVAALSWTGVSRADNDVNSKKSTTTKTHSTSTTKSGSTHHGHGGSGSSSSSTPSGGTSGTTGTDTSDTPGTTGSTGSSSTGMAPSDTTPSPSTSPSTDTTWGTGTDSTYGTQPSVTDTTTMPPATTTPDYTQPTQAQTYSTTTTTAANYDERAGAEKETYDIRPNRPLLFTGLGIFAGSYGTSVIVAAESNVQEDKRLYIPVVGPWLDMGERACKFGDCGTKQDWNNALLVGSGVLQGVGVALTIASFAAKEEKTTTRGATSAREVRAKSIANSKPTVQVTPVNMRNGAGVGAVGTF